MGSTTEQQQRYRVKYPERQREYSKRKYDKRKKLLGELKDRPCEDCGEKYPPYVMDFHHTDPAAKEFTIGARTTCIALHRLLAEIEKCVLLCANCHREREHQSSPASAGTPEN